MEKSEKKMDDLGVSPFQGFCFFIYVLLFYVHIQSVYIYILLIDVCVGVLSIAEEIVFLNHALYL